MGATVQRTIAAACLISIVVGCGAPGSSTSASTGTSPISSPAPHTAAPSNAPPLPTAAPTPIPIAVAAAPLEPALKELWQARGPRPPRDGACCVTLAPDGRVWASTEFGSSFWIVAADGTSVEPWGSQGSGDGQFNFVVQESGYGDVAFDPDGSFYVADTANHRVQKFDKDRALIKAWGTFGHDDGQFVTPATIASDGRGRVYVSDWDRLDIQVFRSDGTFVQTLSPAAETYFIAVDPTGRLFVDDGPSIRVFDRDGRQVPGFDLSATGWLAGGMAFDAAGHLYVSLITGYGPGRIETKAIYELDSSGKVVHAWPGQADALALDPDGQALYSSFYLDPFIRKLALPAP
jgi:sugar lactone lactonase YvrE